MKNSLNKPYTEYIQTEEAYTETYIENTQARIFGLMEEQNKKQNELAVSADLNPQQLNEVLSEGHNATLKTVGKIAFALKVKAVTCFTPKEWNNMLFRKIIDKTNEHVNDERFLKYIQDYNPESTSNE